MPFVGIPRERRPILVKGLAKKQPTQTAIVYLSTVTLPVVGTIDTWQTHAQYVPERSITDMP